MNERAMQQATDFRKDTHYVCGHQVERKQVPGSDISIMRQTAVLLVTCLLTVKLAVPIPLPSRSLWTQCELPCDEHYKPVCAVDETGVMQSFQNRCQFELANCMSTRYHVVLKEGEC